MTHPTPSFVVLRASFVVVLRLVAVFVLAPAVTDVVVHHGAWSTRTTRWGKKKGPTSAVALQPHDSLAIAHTLGPTNPWQSARDEYSTSPIV